jgi:hypothetical protein
VRNYLYSAWVHRHVFRITVVLAGLMIMVISLVSGKEVLVLELG